MARVHPVGGTLDRGAFVIDERLRGEAARGQYRARRAGHDGTFLVTVTLPQPEPAAAIEARLRIPGSRIAGLRHVGPVDGGARLDAIVEEEPPGRPVAEEPQPMPADDVIALGAELARAVEEVHRLGGAVLGLRPELVYAARVRGRIVLTGVAPRCERFHATAPAPGYGVVPSFDDVYLAPEQIERAPAGAPADVFSTCAVLARLAIGAYPFEGDSPWSKAESIIASRRRRLTGPMALVGLLAHGLALRPEDRCSAAELATELGRLA